MISDKPRIDVVPGERIGRIKLGMPIFDATQILGPHFARASNEYSFLDSFYHITFDKNKMVVHIEIGNDERHRVFQWDIEIFRLPVDEVIDQANKREMYNNFDVGMFSGYVYTFPFLGVSFGRSSIPEDTNDEDGRYFNSISVAKEWYFRKLKTI